MYKIPDPFKTLSLTALPPGERGLLLDALDSGTPARGIRLRPNVALQDIQAQLAGNYRPIPWARHAYYLSAQVQAGKHPLHAAGAYYLQEPSAMSAVAALDIHPGQHVLDLCAAPGGKSTQIAALLDGKGFLVSNEIHAARARVLSQNIERMGVHNAMVTSAEPETLARRWPQAFDRVLVDAPCSGEGMFRRVPASREEWTPQSPHGCAERQQRILQDAARMLRPGGLLVYSTCTFNEIENENVIAHFLRQNPQYSPEDFALEGIGTSTSGCLRLWPHRIGAEGHFVARLRREGDAPRLPDVEDTLALCTVDPLFGQCEGRGILAMAGTRLWLQPSQTPNLQGIRVLRSGLSLGEALKQRFSPDHAAALAFPPSSFRQMVSLTPDEAAAYLAGEILKGTDAANGWTAVGYCGLSLGWGKCVDGVLKNHYPKGLRQRR